MTTPEFTMPVPSRDAPAGSARTTLPLARTSLIGRDAELRSLLERLQVSGQVTVIGPAGVGKTRLALEAATLIADSYRDGVRLALLAPIREPDLVAGEVASCLGLTKTGGRSYEEAILERLEGRRLLLVLDNCEHVVARVADLLDKLLARLPDLGVLATSREPLGVQGELVYGLAPLPVPPAGAGDSAVAASDAVQLFVDRARSRRHDFDLDAADPQVVAEICRRLDGLPLAIELAAARVGALAAADVLARLDDRFRLLTSGLRTVDARHRTLRSAVAWSDALLEADERALFRRLSVFAGGFDLEAAIAVCGRRDADAAEVVDGVAHLVDKSLVARDPAGGPRYFMLETVRQFAAERLDVAGEAETVRDAHAAWFVELGRRAGEALRAGSEREWLERLDHDHENLRVALDRLLENRDAVGALTLATSLSMFWWTHGHLKEGIRWLQAGLECAVEVPAALRAAGLFHLGFLWAHDTDDWQHAATFLDRGIALARDALDDGASAVLGYLLCLRGECANFAGDHDTALELAGEGAAIIRGLQDPWGAGFALWNVGFTHRCRGEVDLAEDCFAEMVAIQREHGIGLVLMIGCKSLGELAEARGDLDRAREQYEESLGLRRLLGAARLGDVHGSLPQALLAVARVAAQQGDRDKASEALREALPLAEEMRDRDTLVEARRLLETMTRAAPESGAPTATLRREGDVWSVEFEGTRMLLADSKGLRQLRALVSRPRRHIAAVALATGADGVARELGDAGPLLDDQAVRAYRRRLQELEAMIEEARSWNDVERAARAQAEREAVVRELGRSTGLFGRPRRAGSSLERARVNVTRTLRDAIARIAEGCPSLGAHLDRSVHTGTTCVYEPSDPVAWRL